MKLTTVPEINVQELMQEIREELVHQSDARSFAEFSTRLEYSDLDEIAASFRQIVSDIHPPALVRLSLPDFATSRSQPDIHAGKGGVFHVRDFRHYEGEAFVRAAYLALLRRQVDEDGSTCYLSMLRDGASKIEILGRICDSAEARKLKSRVAGLALPYALDSLCRWPVLGRIVAIALAIWNLPDSERRLRQVTVELVERVARSEEDLAQTTKSTRDAFRTLQDAHNAMSDLTRFLVSRTQFEMLQRALLRLIASINAREKPETGLREA